MSWLKRAELGIAIAAILAFGAWQVNDWREAAAALPAVTQQRDQAQSTLATEQTQLAAIAARLEKIDGARQATDRRLDNFAGGLSNLSNALQGSLVHAVPEVPSCDYDPSVRGMFVALLDPNAGDAAGAGAPGVPGTAGASHGVFRRQPARRNRKRPDVRRGRDAAAGSDDHAIADGEPRDGSHRLGEDGTGAKARTGRVGRKPLSRAFVFKRRHSAETGAAVMAMAQAGMNARGR